MFKIAEEREGKINIFCGHWFCDSRKGIIEDSRRTVYYRGSLCRR